jgi:hypothetical protein
MAAWSTNELPRRDQYQSLLDWASRSKNLGRTVDIPSELLALTFSVTHGYGARLNLHETANCDSGSDGESNAAAQQLPIHFKYVRTISMISSVASSELLVLRGM